MATIDMRSLGEYIREQREAAEVSLRQLAKSSGVSNPYLSQVERGLKKPSAEILGQIAGALRISAETLYVRAGLLETEGVSDVHDLHLWSLDGRTAILSAHLVAAPGFTARRARGAAEATLSARFGIAHTTLQIEEQGECAGPGCALWTPGDRARAS